MSSSAYDRCPLVPLRVACRSGRSGEHNGHADTDDIGATHGTLSSPPLPLSVGDPATPRADFSPNNSSSATKPLGVSAASASAVPAKRVGHLERRREMLRQRMRDDAATRRQQSAGPTAEESSAEALSSDGASGAEVPANSDALIVHPSTRDGGGEGAQSHSPAPSASTTARGGGQNELGGAASREREAIRRDHRVALAFGKNPYERDRPAPFMRLAVASPKGKEASVRSLLEARPSARIKKGSSAAPIADSK